MIKGSGVDKKTLDFNDVLPVNFLAVPESNSFYMRSYPGITKSFDSDGISRGAQYNQVRGAVYRVNGTSLQKETKNNIETLAVISGDDYTPMDYSSLTQCVVANGTANYWNESVLTQIQNWSFGEKFVDSPATDFDLSNIRDVTRNKARYAFIQFGKGGFFVTDLDNEQRPDYISPFYAAESDPDIALGIASWKDRIVVFGRASIEYFELTGLSDPIYRQVNALTVDAGIVNTGCYASHRGSFVILGGKINEPVGVHVVSNGSVITISNRQVEEYIVDQLETYNNFDDCFVESVKFRGHDLVIVHLIDRVLCYDASVSNQNNQQWILLTSDYENDVVHRAKYYAYAENISAWSVGDKNEAVLGRLDHTNPHQYGNDIEYILSTEFAEIANSNISQLTFDCVPGYTNVVKRFELRFTIDGVKYSNPKWINYNVPFDFTRRPMVNNMGFISNKAAMRFKFIPELPLS
jgi:hypothetical protein